MDSFQKPARQIIWIVARAQSPVDWHQDPAAPNNGDSKISIYCASEHIRKLTYNVRMAGKVERESAPPRLCFIPDLGGSMKRVTGIGGIFFKAKDAPALQAWYKRHLGIDVQEWGGTAFTWTDGEGKPVAGTTIWSIGSAQGDQFAPSTATFMVNYRVEDLHVLVKVLREEGCNVLEKIDDSEYGKFAWVIDPEGNKVELWQPPAGQ
jgi:predicted enzyme related to lactoylglutathione lyase